MAHVASLVSNATHREWLDVRENLAQLLQTDQLGSVFVAETAISYEPS